MYKKLLSIIGLISLIAILATAGCIGNGLNNSPPDYIKTVAATREGDGMNIYFILADKNRQETTSDGYFKFIIMNPSTGRGYTFSRNVTETQFQKVKLGMGAFEHEGIIYDLGRIPYADLDKYGVRDNDLGGKVQIQFVTPSNRTLKGETNFYY